MKLVNINKSYGSFQASKDISFEVPQGSLTALLGPSGSGKTTILRMIAGLEQPDSGDIIIGGKRVNDVPASQRGIGFVFQNYALFRYMTVFDNVAFGLKVQKKDKKYIRSWGSPAWKSGTRASSPADSGRGSPLPAPSHRAQSCCC